MNKHIQRSSTAIIVIKALLGAYIISALLLLVLAMIMFKLDPPGGVISIGIIITYILSAFLGGLIIGKSAGQKRFVWGIIIGILYFSIILLVSSIMGKEVVGNLGSTITVFLMCTLVGMLGGMVS